ncbi:acetyl-CoA C-acetyltransferase [Tumebacillus sp. DT12]|uniref:acetyl-CoA C-acetyltransferase n=1 Tax=Tumebacillus lacus TaxID=2995335 RepID=A0ABT3X4G7_9BACL|nr:acetyl-CoA C-acetyltransferase [Tumebacillus lacus]MCX7569629.1 acetyl-CoA C-acetyltransferase [Tumebacillus lacus]
MSKTVIVSYARTPFGKFGGGLAPLVATDLGAITIKEALSRAGVAGEQVDEVIMGMVLQGGAGQVPSRQAAIKAGLSWEVPTQTINKVCASGMRAVTLGDQIIRSGDADVIVAGGMESMSNAPYILPSGRWGMRMGDSPVVDLMNYDGLRCAFHNVPMAVHGSNVAAEYEIPRDAQDAWALRSHERAIAAIEAGKFAEEIVPVEVPGKKGAVTVVDTDEAPRKDTSLDKLATLKPVFTKDGSITAGNAPGVNDGAAAFVLMSEEKAAEAGIEPLATILGHAQVGADAPYIATTPGLAIQKLLAKTGYKVEDIDLFEVNEAFAAVTLTSGKIVGWDEEKVNVNGGAVALGHPVGASGARVIGTLIHELKRRGGGLGVAAICSGAAQGDAVLIRVH